MGGSMDWSGLDVKRGLIGALGILLTVVFVGILGPARLLAGLCAVRRSARFVAIGAVVIGLLSWSGDNTWSAKLVQYLGTLAAGWGRGRPPRDSSWCCSTVVILMVGPTYQSPLDMALAFVAGGAISTAVSLAGVAGPATTTMLRPTAGRATTRRLARSRPPSMRAR
jgi:hypothetical protein